MIRHIVIINFKRKMIDYLALLEKTRPIVTQIPGIVSYHLYPNESKYVPENVISIGAEIIFKDQHSLDIFMNHPKHFEANALFEKYLADPPYMVLTYGCDS
jgi:quinol monooxygenase YgiN